MEKCGGQDGMERGGGWERLERFGVMEKGIKEEKGCRCVVRRGG